MLNLLHASCSRPVLQCIEDLMRSSLWTLVTAECSVPTRRCRWLGRAAGTLYSRQELDAVYDEHWLWRWRDLLVTEWCSTSELLPAPDWWPSAAARGQTTSLLQADSGLRYVVADWNLVFFFFISYFYVDSSELIQYSRSQCPSVCRLWRMYCS